MIDGADRKKVEEVCKKLVGNIELLKEENEMLLTKFLRNKFHMLKLLIKIVEEMNPYSKGHSLRVYRYVMKIARRLKLSKKETSIIGKAALLHDIGKVAIGSKVLNKKGELTDREWSIIQAHSGIGADIVREIEHFKEVAEHILHHHAKYEGGGYPKSKLRQEEIPLGARLIAVADSYDAMRSDRPYRRAYSKEYAMNELKKCAITQYDPKIVMIFINILERETA